MLPASGRLRTPPSAAQRPPEVMGSSPEGPLATFASANQHKLRELRHSLPGWEIELLGAEEFPPEQGETYYENARAKALFGRGLADPARWVLGEDSGVELDALGGGPGVKSSRWAAGREAERALEELAGVEGENRKARYVSEIVAISPEGREVRGTGILEGRIAEAPRGSEGFGFDPVFVPAGEERTVAELGDEWKREHSHRARAAKALLASLG
jgi:XTP/dITP diphosphohydrolase